MAPASCKGIAGPLFVKLNKSVQLVVERLGLALNNEFVFAWTLSQEQARECRQRIRNYRHIKKQVDKLLGKGLENAPWKNRRRK